MAGHDAALRHAQEHVFLCGLDDAAEQLCHANMSYGVAKIRHAEQQLGLEPRGLFIGAPDATVTRNTMRWRQGFGYGGVVHWNPELAVLDAKPNGCGMLVGALDAAPREDRVREAARAAREARLMLEGLELDYDLHESNHFVDALALDEVLVPGAEPPRELFIIHSSGHEHRPASPHGPGLYFDESPELQRLCRTISTPWGELHVLQGDEARRYHEQCARVQRFNLARRELFGRLLFGPSRVVCNLTHQGLRAPGVFHLGSYWFDRATLDRGPLIPLTLGPDQPVYLLRPRPSFSAGAIETLGWGERARRLGLQGRLERADVLPHGGGYDFPQFQRLLGVEVEGGERRFWVAPRGDGPPVEVRDIRALPFSYRGEAVLARVQELGMAEPVARYRIRFVVKE